MINGDLLRPFNNVILAVSGGRDSMAMLQWFISNKTAVKPSFSVVTCDHGIRGAAGGEDAQFVLDFCDRNDVRCIVKRLDAPGFAKEKKLPLEAAARELRYAALKEVAGLEGADAVATAHHTGDNTETILMHVFRGCGLTA